MRVAIGAGLDDNKRLRLARLGGHTQTGRHHGHAQIFVHAFIEYRTKDHSRILRSELADGVHDFVNLLHLQRMAGSDIHQHTARTGQVYIFKQGALHRLLRRAPPALRALRLGRTHHRHAHLAHHGAHVGEVHVDQTGTTDHFGDAGYGAMQHFIRFAEGVQHRHVLAQDLHQLLIGDDDQRVHVLRQRFDAGMRHFQAPAFEHEGLGDHGHGQDTKLFRHFSDYRSSASTGAAAHAGGDEQHIRAVNGFSDFLAILQRRFAPDFRIRARAQTLGDGNAQLQLHVCITLGECLRIGIGRDELHPLEPARDHVVHCITTAAAHADHFDHCILRLTIQNLKHFDLLQLKTTTKNYYPLPARGTPAGTPLLRSDPSAVSCSLPKWERGIEARCASCIQKP